MVDLDSMISFYRKLSEHTSVADMKDFYRDTASCLEDYKYMQLSQAGNNHDDSDGIVCGCCGSNDLFEAYIETTGTLGLGKYGSLAVEYYGDGDELRASVVKNARCCRNCGHIMPYVDFGME